MALHVFVAMPYGHQQDIDFDAVYAEYLKPALEGAGFEVFRADEARRAGDIRADMFQELLLADLVVVDLTLDNPNVWYELGVRHALRARGVLLIQSERDFQPFDIYTERKLRYHLKDGRPDPHHLQGDRQSLASMALATMESWHGRAISPVFQLLDGLSEPAWRSLLLTGNNEFRAVYETWRRRIELARKGQRPGDIMVLAEETPTWALRSEARRMAGKALMQLRQYQLALEQFDAALELDPADPGNQRDKGLLLALLGRHDEAREWTDALLREHGDDPENWCLLGRLQQEDWVRHWRGVTTNANSAPHSVSSSESMRERAGRELSRLIQAIEAYMKAFVRDPANCYAGLKACTLRHLQIHLGHPLGNPASLPNLEGGVIWTCLAALERQPDDYAARACWAELTVLFNPPGQVGKAWREAVAVANKDRFALDASRQQLLILRDLGFRNEGVETALAVLDEELARLEEPWQARRLFLFSGHMIDAAERAVPRFPADREPIAAEAIAAKLDELGCNEQDLAICGSACGGDLLFAEAALRRGCQVHLYLQYDEADFLQASVAFAGESWVDRYYAVKENALTRILIQPDELGPLPKGINAYVRNNLWQLYTALANGVETVRCIALWNGEGGAGPGGTENMVETVRRHSGRVSILDTRQLFGL
ncbi:MAG: tetratricopeptide repeat protein [Propionivibrio sp.]|uniref:tetratricopeptide repeat protein n=1 Tax=Propionivibrio sp. TaxID=2212460 RepID=UPI001A4BDE44|nr:tetratricopeptide repeat protein [Propionivibrio sp.]MBL8413907.1 tetratricopeptide repeat protein [Propionivibrio sp.]